MKKRKTQNKFVLAIRKFLLSIFLVVTFAAYALENRRAAVAEAPVLGAAPAPIAAATAVATTVAVGPSGPAAAPTAPPALPPTTAPTAASGYKDGTYTGSSIDVNWGLVQVQATIQGGKISNVQFLQYPSDRRTSVRINSIAVPDLEQEAVQAQSANVDIITGATLTSEGFQMSLQDALSQARG